METYYSTLFIVGAAVVYLLSALAASHLGALAFRRQLAILFGRRPIALEEHADGTNVLLYPIRWYEQLLWPVWFPVVAVLRIVGVPTLASRNRDADRRAQ